ncbi:MAG: choice-of-anchor tandem repeat GloVer-containing protein [Candidatus Sulfotelmatobacter sp.]
MNSFPAKNHATSHAVSRLAFIFAGVLALVAAPRAARAQTETVLHSFTGGANGDDPHANLILVDEILYGTTAGGGSAGDCGTVFKVTKRGTWTLLYAFTCGADGAYPWPGLLADSEGSLYGTTSLGGAYGWGTIYKVTSAGAETALYSFTGRTDGRFPLSNLVRDTKGNIYGTVEDGGTGTGPSCDYGCGAVFKLTPAGVETVLYSFTGGADGTQPESLILADGNLYGVALAGTNGFGTIFKITLAGKETTLYGFAGGSDGATPAGNLLRDSKGNLYGVTASGGTFGQGEIYELTSAGVLNVLYNFTGGADGGSPSTALIRDQVGNFYGTTIYGGNFNCHDGCGTVYELTPASSETVLYTFSGGTDGAWPAASLVRDSSGNLYGTTSFGGNVSDCSLGCGVVFKVVP